MYHPLVPTMFSLGPLAMIGTGVALIIVLAILWELFWKGLALWHAARNAQWVWFVVMLLVHTAGILEIVYLIWFRNDREDTPIFPFGTPQDPVNCVTVVEETVIVAESDL